MRSCVRWGPDSPTGRDIFVGNGVAQCNVSAMQKRLGWCVGEPKESDTLAPPEKYG